MKRLDCRRVVGHRRSQDQPVVEELAAYLEPELRTRRVPRYERRRHAKALIGFAVLVLDTEHRKDLAREERSLAVPGDQIFELRQIRVEEIAQREVVARARNE